MNYSHHPDNPPQPPQKKTPDNKGSLLLSKDENKIVFDILGKGRQTLSTAVVQLLVPKPDQKQWQRKDTGVVCLVRDTTKKSYFIQVLSLRSKSMVFRQEIYTQFEYKMPTSFFITFEGDNCMVGLNFADTTEASNFREALDVKLEAKKQRRNERRSRYLDNQNHIQANINSNDHSNSNSAANNNNNNNSITIPNGNKAMININNNNNNNNNNNVDPNPIKGQSFSLSSSIASSKIIGKKSKNKAVKGGKTQGIRKEDIGTPMNFRHVQHVGWNPTRGFDLEGVDSDLRTFFEKAGVSTNQLQDENTRQFIYNFIETHGGVDAVKRSINRAPPPLPPSINSGASSGLMNNNNNNNVPPPVPARQPTTYPSVTTPTISSKAARNTAPQPPPPTRPMPPPPSYQTGVPPPTPPTRTTSSHPIIINNNNNTNTNGSSNFVPPPPPPPPPMPTSLGPPPPPMPSLTFPEDVDSSAPTKIKRGGGTSLPPPVEDERTALMKQIQSGVKLKKIDPVEVEKKRPANSLQDCLNQIQKGVALNHVPESEQNKKAPTLDASQDGLAGALARALADRSRAINPSSDEDEDDEDDYEEDEWD